MSPHIVRSAIIVAAVPAAVHAAHGQRWHTKIGELEHTVWTIQDGAPPSISSLAQSADGMLWIASVSGLHRFDGVRFERFEPASQSFPLGPILEIRAMPDTSLWIGRSLGRGVSVLTRGRVVNYSARDSASEGRVYGIARDSTGDTWVSSDGGLARLHDGRWQRMGPEQHYPGGQTGDLLVDRRGALWAPTPAGMFVLPRGGSRFIRLPTLDPKERVPQSVTEAPDGSIWGGSMSLGLTRLSDTAGRPTPARPAVPGLDRAGGVVVDRHANAWISKPASGMVRVPLPTSLAQFEPSGTTPRQSVIEKVPLTTGANPSTRLVDREGNVWFGTVGGLERFRETKLTPVVTLPKGLRWPAIAPAADGLVWLGSDGHPLSLIGGEARRQPGVPTNTIYAYRDFEGGTWVAGPGGLWHAPPSSSPLTARFAPVALPHESELIGVYAVAQTLSGDLWVSIRVGLTTYGTYRRRGATWSLAPQPPGYAELPAFTIVADSAGRVWRGRSAVLVVVNGDSTRAYSREDGLDVGAVSALWVSGPRVWIGGARGLALMDNERFRAIAATVPIRGVTGIVETADGDIWFNGFDGVIHIPVAEVRRALEDSAYRARAERFDRREGLDGQASQSVGLPTAIQGTDGRLWFTTATGVAWIDPANIRRNRLPPPVQVRAVSVGSKRYEAEDRVSLPARTTQLQVAYTSPSLSRPDLIRFRYRLSVVDTAWIEAGTRREAFYTNLRPGSYRFRVTAANEDGVWNEAGASIDLEIPPSFTQTKAFTALIVGVIAATLVGLGWLLAWWRQRQMASALRAQFEGQLAERARIAQDLHDTLLQGFVGVTLQVKAAQLALPEKPDVVAETLLTAQRLARASLEEARERVWDMRASALGNTDLPNALEACARERTAGSGLEISVTTKGERRRLPSRVEDAAFRIGREAIVNAVRHAEAHHVDIHVDFEPRRLRLEVSDDGRGFNADATEQARRNGHFGLSGAGERAGAIGGHVDVRPRPGGGTIVSLELPIEPQRR